MNGPAGRLTSDAVKRREEENEEAPKDHRGKDGRWELLRDAAAQHENRRCRSDGRKGSDTVGPTDSLPDSHTLSPVSLFSWNAHSMLEEGQELGGPADRDKYLSDDPRIQSEEDPLRDRGDIACPPHTFHPVYVITKVASAGFRAWHESVTGDISPANASVDDPETDHDSIIP